ncbi:MAG: SDR family NAD(P)-dependent oxidoreductase [Candidatus Omnitrophica bacterium]|nr:SDR family NAD(P)-dependent oxidoreductase [Candidatus Omnitrophota bacterium]
MDHRTFFEEASKALTAEELGPSRGKLAIGLDENLAKEFFPALMELMSKIQIAELLTSTRLIGMECPGENSLFSDLNVEFKDPKNENYLIFNVLEYDPRFARVTINIQGPSIQGVLGAFLRPSPKQQPSFSQIRTIVAPEEFSGQSALIIGGTRGLGEVTAKILAAGGAKVLITYFKGVDDARRIQEELSRSGSLVQTIFFDAGAPEQVDNSVISAFSPTHLYYFATPFIFDGVKKRFSERLFDSFIDTYVKGFWRVFEKVNACKSLRFVLYPSTSALDEMPINMFEYAVAKAAGESMCAYIKKFFPDVAVVTPRLQRLATDQTVSLVAVNNQDPVPEMLKHLRGSL